MRKNCETCKHDDKDYPRYPFKAPCNECVYGADNVPDKWEAAEHYNPDTNADRIRAMSDEELAEWMAECNAYGENADAGQWLPWLKQPADE